MTLDEFAEEQGTTDDARETVAIGDADDGHIKSAGEISDYWHGNETDQFSNPPRWKSLVPAGKWNVIIDANDDYVKRGFNSDADLRPGVYLDGKGDLRKREISTAPPYPVDTHDEHLKFAAEAGLLAAAKEVSNRRIVAITSGAGWPSLNIVVAERDRGNQKRLLGSKAGPAGLDNPEQEVESRHGFFSIREFGTPCDIYTQADVPRMELDDLDVDVEAISREGGQP